MPELGSAHAAPFSPCDGKVFSTPVPTGDWFHAETIEYVGSLKRALTLPRRIALWPSSSFGAGWGPWLVSGAAAAERSYHKHTASWNRGRSRALCFHADPLSRQWFRPRRPPSGLCSGWNDRGEGEVAQVGKSKRRLRSPPAGAERRRRKRSEERDHERLQGGNFRRVYRRRMLSFHSILNRESQWDLVHIDVQGSETELGGRGRGSNQASTLAHHRHPLAEDRRRSHRFLLPHRLVSKTRSRPNSSSADSPSIEAMTLIDGTQVWRNPRL